ncbi:hypothetical protein Gotur_034493 [Gossypium turneri]
MVAHLSDFGIAKLLCEEVSMIQTMTKATFGYMAPEYGMEGIVSTKGDVYSFGILLMEIITRKKPTDEMFAGERTLKSWVIESISSSLNQVVDPKLLSTIGREHLKVKNCALSILKVGLECCVELPNERLHMKEIFSKMPSLFGSNPSSSDPANDTVPSPSSSCSSSSSPDMWNYFFIPILLCLTKELSLANAQTSTGLLLPNQRGDGSADDSLISFSSCANADPKLYYRPVIGILSHPGDGASGRLNNDTNASYIAASYVKFVEAAGARVIPLIYNEPEEILFQSISSSLNQVVDPKLLSTIGREDLKVKNCALPILQVGLECCVELPNERLHMKEIVTKLKKIKVTLLRDMERVRRRGSC